jgi:regulator of protease activity HflC (stomatin/prohibitin superfamily)
MYLVAVAVIVLLAVAMVALLTVAYRKFFVSINPDEFVIHYGRGGKIKHSGRGVSFFCWPGETYIAVPSTIRDVNYCADQITLEKQGVRVQGFLAYRIDDFELAYQTLDLRSRSARVLMSAEKSIEATDYSTRTSETICKLDPNDPLAKTDLILRRLAESVVRHEVSNKTVDQMIGERESVIDSMKEQIAPTVAKWGLVVETIEFTEVWIRSKALFQDMQAEYRNEIRKKAEQSTSETERLITETRLENEREVARLNAEAQREERIVASKEQLTARDAEIKNNQVLREKELEMARRIQEQEEENRVHLVALQKEKEFELLAKEDELKQQQIMARKQYELLRQAEEQKLRLDEQQKEYEYNLAVEEARRNMIVEEEQTKMEQRKLERELLQIALEQSVDKAKNEAEIRHLASQSECNKIISLAKARKEKGLIEAEAAIKEGEVVALNEKLITDVRNEVGPANLQAMIIQQLTSMASNMKVDEVNWINMDGNGKSPLGIIPENIMQLMTVFKGMGVDLGAILPQKESKNKTKNAAAQKKNLIPPKASTNGNNKDVA